MTGIVAYGGYVPRLRLSRKAAVEANAWFNPALKGRAKGERAICNWDEDALTMAVEAARDCLGESDRGALDAVHLASTTLPFGDRQNAGILAGALNLDEAIQTIDVTASQRAGTSGLIAALSNANDETLYVASDARRARSSGAQELLIGDGAAALLLGENGVVAEIVATHQLAVDFVDHYRGQHEEFDYAWEERWIRDEGYMKIVPRALAGLFEKAGVEPGAIDHFVLPSVMPAVPPRVAKAAGIPADAVRDTLYGPMGEAGTAHALVMLVDALQDAKPGQLILVVGWGQGCDALLLRTTEALAKLPARQGIKGYLGRRREETNYNRYLAFKGLVEQEKGIRAEADISTPPSALYRKREMVTGFVGGRCRTCGTAQFPKSNVCVNPNCGEFHSQDSMPFADVPAKILSWTADNLTYSPDPPAHFGMVVFEEGGRLMADLTDVDVGGVEVGMPMRMVFRVKDRDERRGFTKYFWKAAPDHTKM